MIKVVVVMGGVSSEHNISLKSGEGVVNNLNPEKYLVCPLVIKKDGTWLCKNEYKTFGKDNIFAVEDYTKECSKTSNVLPAFLSNTETRADIFFPVLHGKGGEDGTLQGMLELYGFLYTGSGVLGSSVALNKKTSKQLYSFYNIDTPEFSSFTKNNWKKSSQTIIQNLKDKFGFPIVCKIPEMGSSFGMGIASTKEEFNALCDTLYKEGDEVLFEKFVKGTELTCGVVESVNGDIMALTPTEIVPNNSSAFFDYSAKYEKGGAKEITPARISSTITNRVKKLAIQSHKALSCSGYSRTDMIVCGDKINVLETNTLPGFTETSLIPQGAAASGISYSELLDKIIEHGLSRKLISSN